MSTILKHSDAEVSVEELPTGKNKIRVKLLKKDAFSPTKECETSYPVDLIEKILALKGAEYLCDEILRDESPTYVQRALKYDLLGYLDIEDFTNKRLLDFGCGSGASTMVLARMFPHTYIVGIELQERTLSIARLRAAHYKFSNVELLASPDAFTLPTGIGRFDYVVLSAVYEHLLPEEREKVLLQIWSLLKPGGILFLKQTPNRYFPVELHTTSGLPFLNYLPDRLALCYARQFSSRKLKNDSWKILLRKGIRGGSVTEILGILTRYPQAPTLLNPSRFGLKDRIDLWYIKAGKVRFPTIKKLFVLSAKLVKWSTGVIILPELSLAIQKTGRNS